MSKQKQQTMLETTEAEVTVRGGLDAQRAYVRKLEAEGFDYGLVVADAFVRSVRDIGYKSTATALDELIDNSYEAGAENVHVVFGFSPESGTKPERIAILDDGHGMETPMIRAAVLWGGTHRENSRTGFGRYGYGLPSAAVSQGRRFTVFSKVENGELHQVQFDVDDVSAGRYTNERGRIIVPEPVPATLPGWVADYAERVLGTRELVHGTVVVLDKIERHRLTWKTAIALKRSLLEHFGITYRNFIRRFNIWVDGERVEPLDPLFITPGYRFYDLDDERAEALPPLTIDVKDPESREVVGTVKVRFSYMSPTFGKAAGEKHKERGKVNARFHVLKEHNGIIVLRNGRQIDVVTRCPWLTFVNHDRYWKVEVDFPATLDEEFSMTTAKQQVVIAERMWEILREAGVLKAIEEMRGRARKDRSRWKAERSKVAGKRPSERAMEEAQTFKTPVPTDVKAELERKNQEQLEAEARKRAERQERPVQIVREELIQEVQGHPYKVDVEDHPGAPFYRVAQIGGQKVLYINRAHRFYTDVYAAPDSNPRLRSALEVVLFVIGDCELDATSERRLFYESERVEWSKQLNVALERLGHHEATEDDESAEDEMAETLAVAEGMRVTVEEEKHTE